jgi:uncharacterized protein (TIGR04255 family)
MDQYPKKLNKCPLVEAIFEIRFNTLIPEDAVFGIVYQSLGKIINKNVPVALPIVNLPSEIRRQDPNLKFQPHYQINLNNWTISVGPKTLLFSNRSPYVGWEEYKRFIINALDLIATSGVINQVIRTGLRYINVFEGYLFKNTKLKLEITDGELVAEETTIHTSLKSNDGYYINLQLNNNVNIRINNQSPKRASLIDLDVSKEQVLNLDTFKHSIDAVLEDSHNIERDRFFNLLTDEFLRLLEPEW